MREKSNQADKEVQEASSLKTAGPEGELTAGFMGYCISSNNFSLTMCPAAF
jgi:dynamin GTPase